MPASKAQQEATARYKKANYDRIEVLLPKGRKSEIQALAAAQGESLNGYVVKAIEARENYDMGLDGYATIKSAEMSSIPVEDLIKVKVIQARADSELIERLRAGDIEISEAYNQVTAIFEGVDNTTTQE